MSDSLFLASVMTVVLVTLLPLLFHLTRYLGAKSDNVRKCEPFESGIRQTIGDVNQRFDVKFFLVGIVFLMFDVEVLFLFPWAINLSELGYLGIAEMFVFIGLLVGGLIYVFKSGVLRWI